jgi:hypothetical protein
MIESAVQPSSIAIRKQANLCSWRFMRTPFFGVWDVSGVVGAMQTTQVSYCFVYLGATLERLSVINISKYYHRDNGFLNSDASGSA